MTNNTKQHLLEKLQTALKPIHVEVINESYMHSGPASESHFKIVVVSSYFNDLKLIDRHRFINKLFKKELTYIHALAIHAYTSYEWDLKNTAPQSPKCATK